MSNNDSSSVSQCPGRIMRGRRLVRVCGEWFNVHASGLCKACRQPGNCEQTTARKSRKRTRTPAPGSLEWAEARGGLIGGYETDDSYSGDY